MVSIINKYNTIDKYKHANMKELGMCARYFFKKSLIHDNVKTDYLLNTIHSVHLDEIGNKFLTNIIPVEITQSHDLGLQLCCPNEKKFTIDVHELCKKYNSFAIFNMTFILPVSGTELKDLHIIIKQNGKIFIDLTKKLYETLCYINNVQIPIKNNKYVVVPLRNTWDNLLFPTDCDYTMSISYVNNSKYICDHKIKCIAKHIMYTPQLINTHHLAYNTLINIFGSYEQTYHIPENDIFNRQHSIDISNISRLYNKKLITGMIILLEPYIKIPHNVELYGMLKDNGKTVSIINDSINKINYSDIIHSHAYNNNIYMVLIDPYEFMSKRNQNGFCYITKHDKMTFDFQFRNNDDVYRNIGSIFMTVWITSFESYESVIHINE